MGEHQAALHDFLDNPASAGWLNLAFFRDGAAMRLAARLDEDAHAGMAVFPPAEQTYSALTFAGPADIKVVILGQDPYPTEGHAHGLAFSFRGEGRLPASLKRIFRELGNDLGAAPPASGDLTPWAEQGVLLLNTALSVEAGQAGSHLSLGWQALADQVIADVSTKARAAVFMLWGDKARAKRALIDPRHLTIESAHPSPLAARGDFLGSRPFSRANAWLVERRVQPVIWA